MSAADNQTLTDLILRKQCHAYIDGRNPPYNYVPSLGAGIVFCVLFGLSMALHTVQFIWKRTWWSSLFAIGAMGQS
jgi:hypothetical protein